jgi:hypothetical protein
MLEKVDQIAFRLGMYCGELRLNSRDKALLEDFTNQIINLCIDEVKKTPTSSAFTSFDMMVVKSTIAKSVSQLENLLK